MRLGRRQRDMVRHLDFIGGGRWPSHWVMRADDRKVLESLVKRGLVERTGTLPGAGTYLLTKAGQGVADELAAAHTAYEGWLQRTMFGGEES